MPIPRFQFTIRGLIVIIALCGVGLALLRTPSGVVVVCLTIHLPGFAIGRARGGSGIITGALATAIFFALMTVYQFVHESGNSLTFRDVCAAFFFMSVGAAFAFVFGLLCSGALYLVVEVTNILLHPEQQGRLPEPRWSPRPLRGECEAE
jgi:hypothetical protein